ncbi:MAG: hypothetical protein KDK97_17175 [Verrucomicrobiales bacterium]|nr:hypothetical protein [Verrucomicrobiales bacterium]MCP5557724.1 hypothetical protein [Verrucomicrobiaceae bacterium]
MKLLRKIVLLIALSALTGAVWVVHRSPPVDALRAAATVAPTDSVPDLLDQLRQTAMKRTGRGKGGAAIEISEVDLNRYLARRLTTSLPAQLKGIAAFDGILVDLQPDQARVHLLWVLGAGHLSGASVDLAIKRQGDVFEVEVLRGSYGHLALPRGMMRPLAPALDRVAAALKPEIDALFQMNQVKLLEDKMVLDPRFPAS